MLGQVVADYNTCSGHEMPFVIIQITSLSDIQKHFPTADNGKHLWLRKSRFTTNANLALPSHGIMLASRCL